jgi:hypothetical protein
MDDIARCRDPKTFFDFPFAIASADLHEMGHGLTWMSGRSASETLRAIGLAEARPMPPNDARIAAIWTALGSEFALTEPCRLQVTEFTKAVIWVDRQSVDGMTSAAFYQAPHCTILSDAALFGVPPHCVMPRSPSQVWLLENLYHESLHHQLLTFSARFPLRTPDGSISVPGRSRRWSVSEAVHSLHVYVHLLAFRARLMQYLRASHPHDPTAFTFVSESSAEAMKTAQGLAKGLAPYAAALPEVWQAFVQDLLAPYAAPEVH